MTTYLLYVNEMSLKHIKGILILVMFICVFNVTSNAKANDNVWQLLGYRRTYNSSGKYGTLNFQVSNYKLNEEYNQDEDYNYYAVRADASLSLFEKYQTAEEKFWGGLKYVWLNAGIEFLCYIDGYDVGNLELISYSPNTQLPEKEYNNALNLNLGFSGSDLEAGIDYTFSTSYATNFKTMINKSNTTNKFIDICFTYDGYTISNFNAGDYLLGFLGGGVILEGLMLLENGTVRHNEDSYKTFQQEMKDGIAFIYRRPKSDNGGFPLCVYCYGTQLYIDYDWANSHDFDEIMISSGMMTIA